MSNRSYLREAHLQAHVHSHLPMSDRPFACEEFDCDKRFWTVQHLRAHTEVIQFGKKTFRGEVHRATKSATMQSAQLRSSSIIGYGLIWRANTPLRGQSAQGTFTAQGHPRLHEQRAIGEHEHASSEEEKGRWRGDEVGHDWKWKVEGCTKDYKSKKALTTHHAITHLGKRNFYGGWLWTCICDIKRKHSNGHDEYDEDTGQHADAESESSDGEEAQSRSKKRKTRHATSHGTSIIDEITGVAYAKRSAGGQAPLKRPHPTVEGISVGTASG
ncbi:hypothetical protein H4582DRAFT_2051230 [Lactarius indigo]|nr:hypothetical protein H4582DRAFT_2051230 [Lactarius indigo]